MLSRPAPAADIVVEEVGSELCLMRLDTGDVLVLNQTASDIFLLADGATDSDALVRALATAYGSDPVELAPQITATLLDLEQRGFLVDRPAHSDE